MFECVHKLNVSTALELHEMEGKIIQLQNDLHNLSEQFLSMETVVNSLFDTANFQVCIIVHCCTLAEMNSMNSVTLSCDTGVQLQKYQLP